MAEWHRIPIDEALTRLATSLAGLGRDEARRRLAECGPNELEEQVRRTPLAMLLGQFTDFMILVLIGAAVVAGAIGEPGDAAPIIIIVVLNAVIALPRNTAPSAPWPPFGRCQATMPQCCAAASI
ncbi:cation-transporting P-type ATPase [Geobacter anodireducens]